MSFKWTDGHMCGISFEKCNYNYQKKSTNTGIINFYSVKFSAEYTFLFFFTPDFLPQISNAKSFNFSEEFYSW